MALKGLQLFVDLEENNLNRFLSAIKEIGFKPEVPVRLEDFSIKEKRKEWIEEKGMMVFSLFDPKNPFFLLDVFVEEPFDFKGVFKVREKMKAGNTIIPVVPLKELIKMKENTDRPQDKADVFYLKKIQKEWKDES